MAMLREDIEDDTPLLFTPYGCRHYILIWPLLVAPDASCRRQPPRTYAATLRLMLR